MILIKRLIGYAQQDISLIDLQTTKYRINELTEFNDAYTSSYPTHGTSETLKILCCLNFTGQQEREYKAQQKTFHIPFDTSMFTDTEKSFPQMFNFKHTKLNRTQFEQLTQLLIKQKLLLCHIII